MIILRDKKFSKGVSDEDVKKLRNARRLGTASALVGIPSGLLTAATIQDNPKLAIAGGIGMAAGLGMMHVANKKENSLYNKYHPKKKVHNNGEDEKEILKHALYKPQFMRNTKLDDENIKVGEWSSRVLKNAKKKEKEAKKNDSSKK